MWRWDQGHLAYFQFDALRQMSAFSMTHNFKSASRQELEAATGLPFAAPITYSPWRNYSRVLKLCLLVSEIGDVAHPTHIAQMLAAPGAVTCDEYLHFLARAFSDPSPALEGWTPEAHCRFPLLFVLKYLLIKRAVLHESVSTLSEIFGAYSRTRFLGNEAAEAYIAAVGQHREYESVWHNAQVDARQARESIKVIAQISYLHLEANRIIVSLDAPRAQSFFDGLQPVGGTKAADREAELRRLADQFQVGPEEGFAEYLNTAASDVEDSGFVEGNRIKRTHLVIERNTRLREAYFRTNSSPLCDLCSLNTTTTYPWAKRILDLHHLLPLSSGIQVKRSSTTFDDLVPVCPSCHRAIHRFYDHWLRNEGLEDFPNESQAKVVYQNLKAGFGGAVHG